MEHDLGGWGAGICCEERDGGRRGSHNHDGGLFVEHLAGRGASLLSLPSYANALVTPRPAQREGSPTWRASGTVLVIETEESVREATTRMLSRLGFKVLAATGGSTGVKTFGAHADEIICTFLDLTMPQMDGEQSFHAIRRVKPDARVVVMSGYGEKDVISRFSGLGLAGFLQKPFTPDELYAKIQQVLGEAAARVTPYRQE